MDAFRGMERNHNGFSPHLLEVLEEAGTSISDRTRSYAADTSHDKHSGWLWEVSRKDSLVQTKGKYLLIFSEIRRPSPPGMSKTL